MVRAPSMAIEVRLKIDMMSAQLNRGSAEIVRLAEALLQCAIDAVLAALRGHHHGVVRAPASSPVDWNASLMNSIDCRLLLNCIQ